MTRFRIESDLIGKINVPANALYGAQTRRAVENFPAATQKTIGHYPVMVQALLTIKKAAATVNAANGEISARQGRAILKAADTILREKHFDQFPIHYLHGGGGTSANMNANEVLANLGEEILGGKRGECRRLHPNNHVNLNQSTNDVYPTACHLAVLQQWKSLEPAFVRLEKKLQVLMTRTGKQRRLARTCLQDAVDTTFADLFGGYLAVIARRRKQLHESVAALTAVNLGGTIVGRPMDATRRYFKKIIPALNRLVPDWTIVRSKNLFDAAQNADDLISVSSQLDLTARCLIKIGKDLRLLSSGPEAGLGELTLPAVQPGSSIMPGKVNPVIPEFLIQTGFRVIGNHQMSAAALDHAELDLNVWESPAVFGILDSMELMEVALDAFADKCVAGIKTPARINDEHACSIIAMLTELARKSGYSAISQICKQAGTDAGKIRKQLAIQGYKIRTEVRH